VRASAVVRLFLIVFSANPLSDLSLRRAGTQCWLEPLAYINCYQNRQMWTVRPGKLFPEHNSGNKLTDLTNNRRVSRINSGISVEDSHYKQHDDQSYLQEFLEFRVLTSGCSPLE